jgi:hypothetical protein
MTTDKKPIINEVISADTKEELQDKRKMVMEEARAKVVQKNAFEIIIKGDLVEVGGEEEEKNTGAMLQVQTKGNPIDIGQCFGSIVTSIGQSIVEKVRIPGVYGALIRSSIMKKLSESLVSVALSGFKDPEGTLSSESIGEREECDCEICQLQQKLRKAAEESGGVVSVNSPVKDPQ